MHVSRLHEPLAPAPVRDYARILLGLTVITLGTVALLEATDTVTVDIDVWRYLWPSLLIVGGLAIIIRWGSGATIRADASEDDSVRALGLFGGPDVSTSSQQFRGAALTALFGGVTLDLRSARPMPGGATVSATAAFGGIDIIVPHGWRIAVRAMPIFGGVSDKTDHESDLPPDAPVLRLDAVVAFGGIDIKYEK